MSMASAQVTPGYLSEVMEETAAPQRRLVRGQVSRKSLATSMPVATIGTATEAGSRTVSVREIVCEKEAMAPGARRIPTKSVTGTEWETAG